METISTPQVSTSRITWLLDPDHTNVEFAVKHLMMAKVKGRFADVQGTFELDELDPEGSSLSAVIHTASIDTRQKDRDGHLRSPDFLDVERFPTITFESQRFERIAHDHFRLVGALTIREVTQDVVLEAMIEGRGTDPWGNQRIGITASTTIDRRDFGLTWNQVLETGGILVGNDVKITLDVEATQVVE